MESSVFLKYGIDDDGQLVYIDQVVRGKTALACPYCGVPLLARKGQIKVPHFAHDGPTCAAANREPDAITLPAYDNFNLSLPGKVIQALRRFAEGHDYSSRDLGLLLEHELIKENEWNRSTGYDLTHKGKLPLGKLSLDLFNKFQEPLIAERHEQLNQAAVDAYRYRDVPDRIRALEAERDGLERNSLTFLVERERISSQLYRLMRNAPTLDPTTALTDLHIYRHQWQRILSNTLYFLKIGKDGIYKIGVTTRPVEERIIEIRDDLRQADPKRFDAGVEVTVVGTWAARGNIEPYFLHRYSAHHYPIAHLTEYFRFEDAKAILLDLRRMKAKTLSTLESSILVGQPSPAEIAIEEMKIAEARQAEQARLEAERCAEQARIEAEQQARREQRSANIRAGMRQVAATGQGIGRPKGSHETDEEFLQKPTSQAIRAALDEGLSIRQAAAKIGVSINTVQKVKALTAK